MLIGLIGFTSVAFGQVKLNYSIFFPAPHKNSVLATEWGKEIEKRTGGKVQVTMFYGGTLTPPDKCYDGVVKGISDIGFSVFSYTMGKFPLTEVIDLPLGYKSAVGATKLINEYYNKFKPKEFDDVKVMYLHAHGPGILHTKSGGEQTRRPQREEDSFDRNDRKDCDSPRGDPGGDADVRHVRFIEQRRGRWDHGSG